MINQQSIASQLNISQQTVSRAISRPEMVSEKTRKRVQQLLEEHHYQPNQLANSLKSRRLDAVGVSVPSIHYWYFPSLVQGIQAVMFGVEWQVMITSTDLVPELEQKQLDMFRGLRLGGFIIRPLQQSVGFYRKQLLRDPAPVITIDVPLDDLPDCHFVGSDDKLGGEMATGHLIDLGHRQIAYATENLDLPEHGAQRIKYQGYRRAMEEAGIEPASEWLIQCGAGRPKGGTAFKLWQQIPRSRRPTGVFCHSDRYAAEFIAGALDAGVNVPGDVSVVGYSGMPWTEMLTVPLTTLEQPAEQIGRRAAQVLLDVLDQPKARRQVHRFAPRLISRHSTAPPG